MSDAVIVGLIAGACSILAAVVPVIISRKAGMAKEVKEIAAEVRAVKVKTNEFKLIQAMHGDILYNVLDHLATNNNTGGMKRCLDKYNSFNRHN